jgi:hypothetical protein
MPATTPTLSLPYPLDSDRLEDFPTIAKAAATAIEKQFTPATAQAPVFDGGWKWGGRGGKITSLGALHILELEIARTAFDFERASSEVDLCTIPSSVPVPDTTGSAWIPIGMLAGMDSYPMTLILAGRTVKIRVDHFTHFTQNWRFYGQGAWIA